MSCSDSTFTHISYTTPRRLDICTYGMIHGSSVCPLTTTVYGRSLYGCVTLKLSVLPAAVFAPASCTVNVACFLCRKSC